MKRPSRAAAALAILIPILAVSAAIASARWWWLGELAASFAWQAGIASLIGAALLGVLRAWSMAVIALALGLVNAGAETSLAFRATPAPADGPTLCVTGANLLQTNRDYAAVERALAANDADVIALVELSLPMRAHLERTLSAWPHRFFSPAEPWDQDTWGLGLFSKRALASTERVHVFGCYAPAMRARVVVGSEHVDLCVVHVPRPGDAWRVERRNESIDNLIAAARFGPMSVLIGDLNMAPTSPRWRPLLARTRLSDSRIGFGRLPTWSFRRAGLRLSVPIDHVLTGARLCASERSTFAIPGSDHDGTFARLALSPPPDASDGR